MAEVMTDDQANEMAMDILSLKMELETLQMMRNLMDAAGMLFASTKKSIDEAEYNADEDLEALGKVRRQREKLRQQESKLDDLVKQVKSQEDIVIPHMLDFVNKVMTYGGILEEKEEN